jgi:hypothetical protein
MPESEVQAEQMPIAALPRSYLELIRAKTSIVAPTVLTICEKAIFQQWKSEDQGVAAQGLLVWVGRSGNLHDQ